MAADDGRSLGRGFWLFWSGSLFVRLMDTAYGLILPLLLLTATTAPALVASYYTIASVAGIAATPFIAVVVDRTDRKLVWCAGSASMVAVVAAYIVLIELDALSLAAFYVLALISPVSGTVMNLAGQSLVPQLVHRTTLLRAAGLESGAEAVAALVVPPVAGALFAWSVTSSLMLSAAFGVVAIIIVMLIPGSFRVREEKSAAATATRHLTVGIRWIWANPTVRTMCIIDIAHHVAIGALLSIIVLWCQEVLGVGEVTIGILFTVSGAGHLVGALVANRVASIIGPGRLFSTAIVLLGLGMVVIGLVHDVWITGIAVFVLTGAGVSTSVVARAAVQGNAPDAILGRAKGAYLMLVNIGFPLGAALAGGMGSLFGLWTAFVGLGGGVAALALVTAPAVSSLRILSDDDAVAPPDRGA